MRHKIYTQAQIFKQKIDLKQKFGVEFKRISDSPFENVNLIEMFLLNLTIRKKFNRKKLQIGDPLHYGLKSFLKTYSYFYARN